MEIYRSSVSCHMHYNIFFIPQHIKLDLQLQWTLSLPFSCKNLLVTGNYLADYTCRRTINRVFEMAIILYII